MSMHTVATNCRFCGYLCGVTATVEDGRVISVEPDPSRYPYDPRIQAGCVRWPRIVEFLDHPERINFPLKRVGSRGSGEWERVSWAEALDDIAARLERLAEEYGPEALSSSIGGPHATYWPLHRFMSVFGTPNNMGIGQICWNPVVWMNTLTFGWHLEADFDPSSTGALILWGTNPAESDNSAFWRAVRDYASAGGTLIVIDPRRSRSARHASLWLPVRPGTDCALALGLIHTIIAEDLYDHAFVERWCHGFEELRAHVADYAPELVSGITGVPADDIRKAARLFASASTAALSSRVAASTSSAGTRRPRTAPSASSARSPATSIGPARASSRRCPTSPPKSSLSSLTYSRLPSARRISIAVTCSCRRPRATIASGRSPSSTGSASLSGT